MDETTSKTTVTINAPASKVWEALTNPDMIEKYLFGTRVTTDWQVGSSIIYKGSWEGKEYEDKGVILEMVPNKLIKTTYWSNLAGTEDKPENYVTLSYILNEENGVTTFDILQENSKDKAAADQSASNWKMVMDGLKNSLKMKNNSTTKDSLWKDYYSKVRNLPHSKLLEQAIGYTSIGKALDLGAGSLRDTKYLLELGFKVTAVDSSSELENFSKELNSGNLTSIISTFEDFDYPTKEFDLANATFSLPFNSPQTFTDVFDKIKNSLKTNGIFTGQLFGINDEWNKLDTKMTFLTLEQVQQLLGGLEIIILNEIEKEDTTASGKMKHWHIFNIIARTN